LAFRIKNPSSFNQIPLIAHFLKCFKTYFGLQIPFRLKFFKKEENELTSSEFGYPSKVNAEDFIYFSK